MSTQLQLRRDTAANIAASTPAAGEPWYDTTNKRLNIGDGSKVGGIEIPNYLDIQNGSFDYALDTGTANALVITTAPSNPTAYVAGQRVRVKIANTNTGSSTINWGGLGVKTIRKWSNGTLIDLSGTELTVGMIVTLDYDGTYFVLLAGSGGGIIISRQVFTSSGTWTKPSGLLYADVEVVGGGGGGGGADAASGGNPVAAGGGGGGGYSRKLINNSALGATEAVTVGGGGSGGNGTTATNGSTGGTSSFAAHCSATGGGGGALNNSTASVSAAAAGGGGSGTGGNSNHVGGGGSCGIVVSGTVAAGGSGGSSYMGGGWAGRLADGQGEAGGNYGGGGGGGRGTGTSGQAGGSGSAGVVIVTEYRSA